MSSSFFRRTALGAALATGAATMVAVPASVADEPLAVPRTVELAGTLLVVAGEHGEADTYSVRRPNGQVVPIDPGTAAAFDHDVATSDRFSGRVTLPVVNGRTTSLRGAARSGTPLKIQSASVHARPTASGPVVHRLAIAQVNNLGTYSRDSASLLAQVKVATDYWVDQADGKISSYTIPTAPVPYATTKTSVATGCGLTGDQTTAPEFEPVAQEAAALFPGYDFVNGTDQLIVLMPDACRPPGGTGAVGRGRTGVSVASGGLVIATNWTYLADTLAHEFGHNYGLKHAKSPTQEYGDLYEVMGSGNNTASPELGTGYRQEQGLLQAGEVASLTGASGSATIGDRAAVAETGVRSVEVIDPDNGDRLWFDLRTGLGSDAGSEYRLGVTAYGQAYRPTGVVIEKDVDAGVQLLFPNGQTALAAGETWSNASGTMRVGVTALNAPGGSASLASTYAPGPAVTGGSVTVGGTYRPFEEATAIATGFSPAANGVRYQWFASGAPIPNEDGPTFDVPLSLVGASLQVQATGYAVGRAPSAPVMSPAVTVPPANFYIARGAATYPTISGTFKTGQVLSTTGLSWVGDDGRVPSGFVSGFQWYRGRKAIKGATGASYRLTAADLKQYVSVVNLVWAPGFELEDAGSDSSLVKKGKLPSSKPRIKFKGKSAKVGAKLKARTGTWLSKVKFRFQWYAGGRKIRGATKKTFTPGRGLRKKKVAVKVTGSRKGYKATARKSSAVKIR